MKTLINIDQIKEIRISKTEWGEKEWECYFILGYNEFGVISKKLLFDSEFDALEFVMQNTPNIKFIQV